MSSQEKIARPCRIEFGFCQEHQSGEVHDQPMGYCEEWAIHGPRRAPSERENAREAVIEAANVYFEEYPNATIPLLLSLKARVDALASLGDA